MRSYEAARSLFSFLAFCAWSVVILGVLVALIGAGGGSRYGGAGAGLLAMVPGIGICLAGLLLVAFVQMGRANVDTAEYTQQMLKIARDQLEVSQQSLKQGDAFQKSYSTLNKDNNETPQNSRYALNNDNQEDAAPNRETLISNYGKKTSYNGHAISEANGIFHVENAEFRQLEHAKAHIDMLCEKTDMMDKIAELSAVASPELKPISSQTDSEPKSMRFKSTENESQTGLEKSGFAGASKNENGIEHSAPIPASSPPMLEGEKLEYMGQTITHERGMFMVDAQAFRSLDYAKNYAERAHELPNDRKN